MNDSSPSDFSAGPFSPAEPESAWRRGLAALGRRPIALLVAVMVVWGLTDVRSRGRLEAGRADQHRTDLTVYTEAGAAFFDGRDPYRVTNARGWGYLYPPLFAILVSPLHALDPQWQAVVWYFLCLAMLWGCYRECVKILRRVISPDHWPEAMPNWLTAAVLTAMAFPVLNCLQRGQVGVLKTWLLLCGIRLVLESTSWRKPLLAGLALAAAIVLKITPLLPVGLLIFEQGIGALQSQRRGMALRRVGGLGLGTSAGLLLGFLLLPSLLVGWQRNATALGEWWNLVAVRAADAGNDLFEGGAYTTRNQSLLNAVRRLGNWTAYAAGRGRDDREMTVAGQPPHVTETPLVDRTLLICRISIIAVAVLLALRAGLAHDRMLSGAVFGLNCAATLIVAPISRGHYFILLLPALFLVPLWLQRGGRSRLAKRMAWTPAALLLAHYLLLPIAGRAGVLGIGITVWFLTAAVLILRGERAVRTVPGAPHIKAFRVEAEQHESVLQIHQRAVAPGSLRALLPNLAHHKADR